MVHAGKVVGLCKGEEEKAREENYTVEDITRVQSITIDIGLRRVQNLDKFLLNSFNELKKPTTTCARTYR